MLRFLLIFVIVFVPLISSAQEWQEGVKLRAHMVSLNQGLKRGESAFLAIGVNLDKQWHIYWRNPGDSGSAPKISGLSPAWQPSSFFWPPPVALPVPPLLNFGYEGSVYLPFQVTPPKEQELGPTVISLVFDYLVCKEECIPGKTELSLETEIFEPSQILSESQHGPLIRQVLKNQPIVWQKLDWSHDDETIQFKMPIPPQIEPRNINKIQLFPYSNSGLANQGHLLTWDEHRIKGSSPRDLYSQEVKPRFLLEISYGDKTDYFQVEPARSDQAIKGQFRVIQMAFFAFVGGLILNLMPCVFPVLTIKVFSLINHVKDSRARRISHSLSYGFGVLSSLWILLGALLILKNLGIGVGWGFQLQSPIFVTSMAMVFFLLSLNFLSIWQPFDILTRSGNLLGRNSHGLLGSFGSGLLAVLVASPCTAPFMGVALGFALGQGVLESAFVFTFLGLGFALPFMLLGMFPSALSLLPKPGAWMEILRQFFAFPLLLTVTWLLWILGQQVGSDGIIACLMAFCCMGVGIWAFRLLRQPRSYHSFFLFLGLACIWGLTSWQLPSSPQTRNLGHKSSQQWLDFMSENLDELRSEGSVFIDFTAAWCVTCQVNKKVALQNIEVLDAFKRKNVILVRADWTDYNPEIARWLEKFERSGVPLYLLYKHGSEEPVILSEVLTPRILMEAIEQL